MTGSSQRPREKEKTTTKKFLLLCKSKIREQIIILRTLLYSTWSLVRFFNMSAYKRVQQWATFAKTWHLYDASWQDPYLSAKYLKKYITGEWKPIFHPLSNCGDHVVVINTKQIALRGDEWKKRVYFHHRTYPGSDTWTPAWALHDRDPTMIMWKAIYVLLGRSLQRRHLMTRLHLYPDDKIPDDIACNITSQLRQLRPVPTKTIELSEEEKLQFPQLFDLPEGYLPENIEKRVRKAKKKRKVSWKNKYDMET